MGNMTRVSSMMVLAVFVVAAAGIAQASGPIGVVAANNLHAYQWNSGRQPGGSYQQTCQNIRMNGNRLDARCQKRDGGWRDTSIDVSSCRGSVDNDDGNLRCSAAGNWQGGGWNGAQPRGSYRDTCQNIRMNGNRLEARCQKRDGGWRDTSIDLNGCRGRVNNENGNLRCDNSGNGDWRGDRNDWRDDDDRNWRGGQPRGSYVRTCQNIRMHGNRLEARCQKSDGGWRDTSLDMNGCRGGVANDDGHLRCDNSGNGNWEGGDWNRDRDRDRDHDGDRDRDRYRGGNWGSNLPSGSYRETCRNIRINGNRVEASCQRKNGSWNDTAMDLNKCNGSLRNDNGDLRCGY